MERIFTESLIGQMADRNLCIARKIGYGNLVDKFSNMAISADGSAVIDGSAWKWSLSGDGMVLTNGVEIVNLTGIMQSSGSSFVVGINRQEDNSKTFNRIVFESKRASSCRILYLVSSTSRYSSHTTGRCVSSLLSCGIKEEDVMVILGDGRSSVKEVRPDGVVQKSTRISKRGYTAMSAYPDILNGSVKYDYIFLLNDTSVVLPSFIDKVGEIEVGLPFDFISIGSPGDGCEIGLYSMSAANMVYQMSGGKDDVYSRIISLLPMVRGIASSSPSYEVERTRDVYGNGTIREVRLYKDIGIRKFSSISSKNALP
jgi:hypothetical protein